ncbi:nuclease-related domain-containing protein [Galbibacter mesophilus]|uniref:nuclease-related domain-containing protein n=1 Tax=Galbibacter mesophilus TaxID=379069 RepID=UPI00191EBB03|nr:nuclease-related domain-containing protein [Galbibacter mesophilus]MCM5662969.1 NERD domain-containing protein [Galbibacter mesophilus]
MARVYGKIESLKSLKCELEDRGIFIFSSIRDIKTFLSNYNTEKLAILNEASKDLEREYFDTLRNIEKNIKIKNETINFEKEKLYHSLSVLKTKINLIKSYKGKNLLKKIVLEFNLYFIKNQYMGLVKNRARLINSSVKKISVTIENDRLFIKKYKIEKQNLIEQKTKPKTEKLEYIRNVLENSKNLISGAIGENLVVKEIKKLSDDFVLINDFKLNFPRPIFYKKYNQRIYSIQIDHLLISKAGIFIIETKNWSKSSVNSLSLRSPIEQIERANFALYVYLSENITLYDHHWGEQQIPIRNLIVMINNKPKGKFKYVKIKLLKEMNDYIQYFEPVLTKYQMDRIVKELI